MNARDIRDAEEIVDLAMLWEHAERDRSTGNESTRVLARHALMRAVRRWKEERGLP